MPCETQMRLRVTFCGPSLKVDSGNPQREIFFPTQSLYPLLGALLGLAIPNQPPAAFLHFWILTCVRVHNYSRGWQGGQAGRRTNAIGLLAARRLAEGTGWTAWGKRRILRFMICL